MKLPKRVKITEVGPRDGLQNEPKCLSTEAKVQLIHQLVGAGITEIEATSFVHPKWIPNLADAEEVVSQIKDLPVTFFGLVPNARGYDRAVKSGINGITFVMSATEGHSRKNLNRGVDESLAEFKVLNERAQADGFKVRASLSTVFGCPFDGNPGLDRILYVVNELVESGFKRIGLCDTIGVANPLQVYQWVTKIKQQFEGVEFELHFHDTYGRGLPNVLAGLQAGIDAFDSSIGGLGGCPYAPGATGNISTEDLVEMLHLMDIETGILTKELLETSNSLYTNLPKPLESKIWRVKNSICSNLKSS